MLFCTVTLQVLGTLCSKAPDQQLLHASGKSILGALESSLKAINSKSALKSTERHIHTGLRALNIILTSAQSKHGLNMIDLVEILRQCFTFGVDLEAVSSTVSPSGLVLSPAGAQPASAVRQTAARYRPPHRRQSSSNSGQLLPNYQPSKLTTYQHSCLLSLQVQLQSCFEALFNLTLRGLVLNVS